MVWIVDIDYLVSQQISRKISLHVFDYCLIPPPISSLSIFINNHMLEIVVTTLITTHNAACFTKHNPNFRTLINLNNFKNIFMHANLPSGILCRGHWKLWLKWSIIQTWVEISNNQRSKCHQFCVLDDKSMWVFCLVFHGITVS